MPEEQVESEQPKVEGEPKAKKQTKAKGDFIRSQSDDKGRHYSRSKEYDRAGAG